MRHRSQAGASSVEYGLLVGLIAAMIFGAVLTLGQTSGTSWRESCTKIIGALQAIEC